MILFYDFDVLLKLSAYVRIVFDDENLLPHLIGTLLDADKTHALSSQFHLHKVILILYESLKHYLRSANVTSANLTFVLYQRIFEQVCNRLQIYLGGIKNDPRKRSEVNNQISGSLFDLEVKTTKTKKIKINPDANYVPRGIGYQASHGAFGGGSNSSGHSPVLKPAKSERQQFEEAL